MNAVFTSSHSSSPAEYTVQFKANGFKQYQASDIHVQVAQVLRLDVDLTIGQVKEILEMSVGRKVLNHGYGVAGHCHRAREDCCSSFKWPTIHSTRAINPRRKPGRSRGAAKRNPPRSDRRIKRGRQPDE